MVRDQQRIVADLLGTTSYPEPLVRIVPAREPAKTRSLLGTVVHEDEDIFSTGESWDADG